MVGFEYFFGAAWIVGIGIALAIMIGLWAKTMKKKDD